MSDQDQLYEWRKLAARALTVLESMLRMGDVVPDAVRNRIVKAETQVGRAMMEMERKS